MKEKKMQSRKVWLVGILLALLGTLLIASRYPMIPGMVEVKEPSIISIADTKCFPQFNYILYRNLYNSSQDTMKTYSELYGPEEYPELVLTDDMLEHASELEWKEAYYLQKKAFDDYLVSSLQQVERLLSEFTIIYYDFWIQDRSSGKILTNTTHSDSQLNPEDYAVYMEFFYDESGNMTIGSIRDSSADSLRSQLYNYGMQNIMESLINDYRKPYINEYMDSVIDERFFQNLKYKNPEDCVIVYGISQSKWTAYVEEYAEYNSFWNIYGQYVNYNLGIYYLVALTIMMLLGWFYANPKNAIKQEATKWKKLPFEVLVAIVISLFSFGGNLVVEDASWLYIDHGYVFAEYGLIGLSGEGLTAYALNLLVIMLVLLVAWYCGCELGEIRILGHKEYFNRRGLLKKAWNRFKSWLRRYYDSLVMLDVTKDVKKKLFGLVVINAIILFLFTSLWVFSWFGVLLYSMLLYWLLKRYISDIQKKYACLLSATNQIAEGILNVKIEENLGVFEPFKPEIYRIQNGFKKAVEEEVKSQRMKTELITNVSHDLKTPLTAIITYVNLLKEENTSSQDRQHYLEILESKSLRLKALIEDLFEVSKANSGNVTLHPVDVDLVNLLKQVHMEYEDKLTEKQLTCRLRLPEEKITLLLDSEKAYRIYENLFGNIVKYAMSGTRVYVDMKISSNQVAVSLKNITDQELEVSAEELTERFVRGDTSRGATDGSGLGLAIVKSFTELMGGQFYLSLDGDLFTATTVWPISWE